MTARSLYLGMAVLLCACAGAPKQVVSVARTDLACEQVSVSELGDNRYAASGCGRGGVYANLCNDQGCSWVRLRSATEATAGGYAPALAPAAPREIISAPPPAQREVIAAPPPAQREILPAPPPANSAQTPAADAAAAPQNTTPAQSFTPQESPLSQGELSDPYEAEVPVQAAVQRVEYAPPVTLVEQRPPPPAPTYVWVDGYWWWNQPRWMWVSGYWCPPRVGYRYVRGNWYFSSGYWWYGPGGWARPWGATILHPLPPRPHRVTVVRDFRPHYATARAPSVVSSGSSLTRAPGRVYNNAPPSRAYAPQGSPLYRYPTHSAPATRPFSGPGARFSAPRQDVYRHPSTHDGAGAPRRFEGGLRGSGPSHSSPAPSYSSPGASFSRPKYAPPASSAPHHSSPPRGATFSGGRSSGGSVGGSMSAPLRATPSRAPNSPPRGAHLRGR